MPINKPNIILFFTDQHRLSGLSCYGETVCQTPHVDQMAEEGNRFETAYTCCPLCSPARASIQTGLHVHGHGLLSNNYEYGTCMPGLPDGDHLLPRKLAKAGYRCGYAGKWHLGKNKETWFGAHVDVATIKNRGYEMIENDPHSEYVKKNGYSYDPKPTTKFMRGARFDGPPEASISHWLTNQSMSLMDRFLEDDKPFFLMHSDPGPHAGYEAPQELYDMYKDVEIPQWPNFEWDSRGINGPHQVKISPTKEKMVWEDWADVLRHYYARCTLIDMQLGRIREYLKEKGIVDNTMIIFTSDHGETLGSHGGLVDKGWHHFEETHRIGMVLDGPGKADPGKVLSEWASNIDVYPTILDAAGAEYDQNAVHGRSLMPLIRGEEIEWRDEVFTEFFGLGNMVGQNITCRAGNIKYGWNVQCWDELYDLAKDPYEMNNVAREPEYAEALLAMRKRVEAFMERTGHKSLGQFRATRMYNID